MTKRSEYARKSVPWIAYLGIGIAAGGVLGILARDRILEGGMAEYEAYGLLADVAQLEYDNAPATLAIVSTKANIAALEECRQRPKHKYPCQGIPLIRAYAMLAELNSRAGDSAAASATMTKTLQECTALRHRPCTADDVKRCLPAARKNGPAHP